MGAPLQPGGELVVRHFLLPNESLFPPIPDKALWITGFPIRAEPLGPQAGAGPRPGTRGRLPSARIPIGWAGAERGEAGIPSQPLTLSQARHSPAGRGVSIARVPPAAPTASLTASPGIHEHVCSSSSSAHMVAELPSPHREAGLLQLQVLISSIFALESGCFLLETTWMGMIEGWDGSSTPRKGWGAMGMGLSPRLPGWGSL